MTANLDPPDEPLRIVSIGGGTGLSILLHGLKQYTAPSNRPRVDITAVVTVTDDGGSSGRLRREFDVLPPGDIRNCMVALSEDEALLSKLFRYRFAAGRGLKGHSFGNLFLTALSNITGDFAEAVKLSCEVLAIAGRIYPSTSANITLEAVLENGTVVQGETRISKSQIPIKRVRLLPARRRPLPETLEAISNADLITMGPGSLYTSVLPNLLVGGIANAIARSHATRAYFVNLMWQPGETMHFRASDHIRAIDRHVAKRVLDCAIINTRPIRPALKQRYARAEAQPVENDLDGLERLGVKVISGNLLQESAKVRHSPTAIAAIAVQLARESRLRLIGMNASGK